MNEHNLMFYFLLQVVQNRDTFQKKHKSPEEIDVYHFIFSYKMQRIDFAVND